MRNRVLLSAGAIALLATSCAQPEPQVLSEAPRSASTAELTPPSQTAEYEAQPGRFIARCATEADGGTPGMTFFTDGSQNVTDHCLSRYYIGVQPAPGALYVPDEDAGSLAPTRDSATSGTSGTSGTPRWTPAQPRTDEGPRDATDEERETVEGDPTSTEPGESGTDESGSPTTSPGQSTPTSPPTTPTDPSDPDTTDPDTGAPGTQTPGETGPTPAPGSSEPPPTEVPTAAGGTQQSDQTPPPGSAGSVDPTGSLGSLSSHAPAAPQPSTSSRGQRGGPSLQDFSPVS